jgi:hypothetical protein
MFISGQPTRFEYEAWIMCSSDNFPFKASIYRGKSDKPETVGYEDHHVLSYVERIPSKKQHTVFFDKFFFFILTNVPAQKIRNACNQDGLRWKTRYNSITTHA